MINILKSETLASFGVSRVDEPIINQHTIEKTCRNSRKTPHGNRRTGFNA
ncbi:hypothetical protein BIFBRE_03138 [Bifidobacterium breve DSM 20213 = JCM 1192]|uniref:Uncharacterized protein n=1 Tax=Bifidobacterium breve DSM 20213 = JCM 1192 TaxID=518634 RepID=D4BM47_BIFBR|nr:hypothetical protein BIFBRE_03138 [Bifidobacterium breve DSM 20213 = JCM 1192]